MEDREKHPRREGANGDAIAIKTCPECFAVIKASNVTCPLCGHDFSAEIRKIKQKKDQKLQAIKAQQIHINYISTKKPEELNSFRDLALYGKLHGFKPGWAWYKAKQKGFI